MSDRDTKLNNDGQADGAEPWGSYDPPHGVVETILGDSEKCYHENAVYDNGFHNAREQKK